MCIRDRSATLLIRWHLLFVTLIRVEHFLAWRIVFECICLFLTVIIVVISDFTWWQLFCFHCTTRRYVRPSYQYVLTIVSNVYYSILPSTTYISLIKWAIQYIHIPQVPLYLIEFLLLQAWLILIHQQTY